MTEEDLKDVEAWLKVKRLQVIPGPEEPFVVDAMARLVDEVRGCWRQIRADEKAIEILNAELDRLRAAQEH